MVNVQLSNERTAFVSREHASVDGYMALPLDVLGKRYVTTSYFPPRANYDIGQLAVLAHLDDTEVKFTMPSHNSDFDGLVYKGTTYAAGEVLTVTMQRFVEHLLYDSLFYY